MSKQTAKEVATVPPQWWDLATMSDQLAMQGVIVSAATLRRYANHSREPHLDAVQIGGSWCVVPQVAMKWAVEYSNAPKLGRRGDGSVRRKGRKIT